ERDLIAGEAGVLVVGERDLGDLRTERVGQIDRDLQRRIAARAGDQECGRDRAHGRIVTLGCILGALTLDRRTVLMTGLTTSATRGRTAPRAFVAQVLGEGGAQVALGARPVTVGAHASCDLVLSDAQVSRRHAELAAVPEGVRVKDLGSTNG